MERCDKAESEVKRLRAAISKLPHTKDGVLIAERCELWFSYEGVIKSWMCPAPMIAGLTLWSRDDEDVTVCPGQCYSTREAAEAAEAAGGE
jgi:hypothetical protein